MAAYEPAGPGHEHATARPGRVLLRAQARHRPGNLLGMRLLVCVLWFARARRSAVPERVATASRPWRCREGCGIRLRDHVVTSTRRRPTARRLLRPMIGAKRRGARPGTREHPPPSDAG